MTRHRDDNMPPLGLSLFCLISLTLGTMQFATVLQAQTFSPPGGYAADDYPSYPTTGPQQARGSDPSESEIEMPYVGGGDAVNDAAPSTYYAPPPEQGSISQAGQPYQPYDPYATAPPQAPEPSSAISPTLDNPSIPAYSPEQDTGVHYATVQEPIVQDTPQPKTPTPTSTEDELIDDLARQVADAVAKVKQDEARDEADKKQSFEYQAQEWLDEARRHADKTAEFQAEMAEAPEQLVKAKQELDALYRTSPILPPIGATLAQLEQGKARAEEEHKEAVQALEEAQTLADSALQANRKAELAKEKEGAETLLAGIDEQLASSPDHAERLLLESHRRELTAGIALADVECQRLDALAELFSVRRDLAQRQVPCRAKEVEACRTFVADYRKAESKRESVEARRVASEAHPAFRDMAERNADLAEKRARLTADMEEVAEELTTTQEALSTLEADFKNVVSKVEIVGMTPTNGLLLRGRREHLPDVSSHAERIRFCGSEMQRVQEIQLGLDTQRNAMGDEDALVEQAIGRLEQGQARIDPAHVERTVRQLLYDRRGYLDSLQGNYRTYHTDLSELAIALGNLTSEVEDYADYVDENVLWIRSAKPLLRADLVSAWHGVAAFVSPATWGAATRSIASNVSEHPFASTMLVIACLGLVLLRQRIAHRIERIGELVTQRGNASLVPTLRALFLTLLLAAVWPSVLWGIGWWLSLNADAPALVVGLARGLKSVSMIYFAAELFRQTCRPGGLAEKHFDWQVAWVSVLHRSINWLMALGLPAIVVIATIDAFAGGAWQDSLGRLAALAGLVVLAGFMHETFKPYRGAAQIALSRAAARWPRRLRWVWYVAGVGTPITLAVLMILGYSYSVEQLLVRLQYTVFLVLGLVLAHAVLLRAAKLAWHRVRRFRASREAAIAALEREGPMQVDGSTGTPVAVKASDPDAEDDPQRNHRQLGQLVRVAAMATLLVGGWVIWSDMFTAFQVLDRVELWSTMQTAVDGTVTREPVTLIDLIFSVVIAAATFTTARTLPGLLEIAILGRLPIDHGIRHATVIICRYLVMVVGLVASFRMLGTTWESVQWLAAAMTFGLGFGLQEIFANLVSGLLILFERPIRIGDMVTVNGTTGHVTSMRIRSTTITDLDRRELVVPNKRFITDEVINWTLSDPITRFIIPVGIAYSCDPSEAHKLLLKLADMHPLILDEPSPSAVFVEFGDSTLNLELRVFIASRDQYATALHELNIAIERAFREANIEIAFPQRDLNIRNIDAEALAAVMPEQGRKAA